MLSSFVDWFCDTILRCSAILAWHLSFVDWNLMQMFGPRALRRPLMNHHKVLVRRAVHSATQDGSSQPLLNWVYASKATKKDISDEDMERLLTQARKNNHRDHITGLLLYVNGAFIQVWECTRVCTSPLRGHRITICEFSPHCIQCTSNARAERFPVDPLVLSHQRGRKARGLPITPFLWLRCL